MITDQSLIDKYGRLCGHVAQALVRKSCNLTQEDAEDFASAAHLKLIKCPQEHRHEDPYVRTLINNAIRNVWRKRIGQLNVESVSILGDHTSGSGRSSSFKEAMPWAVGSVSNLRDRQQILAATSGDGLPHRTQRKFDCSRFEVLITLLPEIERTVMQLFFGLAGCKPISQGQIAKKLGRSREWVEPRLVKGIELVREQARIACN